MADAVDAFLDAPEIDAVDTFLDAPELDGVDTFLDAPSEAIEAPSEPLIETDIAEVGMNALRLLETFPELATRMSRGDDVNEAVLGTADFVAGVGPSAVDEESAKLAGTFTAEQPAGQAGAAMLNAIAKLGGVPTGEAGRGVILGPLELARQALKADTAAVKAITEVPSAKAAKESVEATAEEVAGEAARVEKAGADVAVMEEARASVRPEVWDGLSEPVKQEGKILLQRGGSNASAAEAGERAATHPEVTTLAETVAKIDGAPVLSRTGKVINFLAGKATTPIRKMAEFSPSLMKVVDMMDGAGGFHHGYSRATGTYLTKLNDAVENIRKWTGGVNRKVSESIVSGLRGGATKHVKEVAAIRRLLTDFHGYLRQAGVDVGFQKNFFPRKYNVEYLSSPAGRAGFINDLEAAGVPRERAGEALENIINNGGFLELGVTGRRIKGGAPITSSMKGRTLDVPDEVLAPYLRSDNMYTVLRDYMEQGIRTAEYTRRFGQQNQELNRLLADASKELGAKGKDIAELGDHVFDVADTLTHSYAKLPPNSTLGIINKVAVPAMHILTLPLAAVASLTEAVMILGRASLRPTSTLKALPAVMNHVIRGTVRQAFKGVEKAPATRAAEEVGLGIDAASTDRLTALSKGDTSIISSTFFKANFLHQWTRFVMVAANETGKHMAIGHLKELARGSRNSNALMKDLASLGVDINQGLKWVADGADEAAPFFDKYIKGAGLNFTNSVVMVPKSTSLPLWHSNPRYKLLAQLKSFPTMFGNTIMTDWGRQIAKGTPKQKIGVAATGALATIGGMTTTTLQDYIRHGADGNPRKDDWTPMQHVAAGVEKFGGLGMLGSGKDAFLSAEFGKDPATVVLGPTVAKVTDVIKAAAAKDKPRAAARVVASNLSFVSANKEVRENVAEAVEDFLREFE